MDLFERAFADSIGASDTKVDGPTNIGACNHVAARLFGQVVGFEQKIADLTNAGRQPLGVARRPSPVARERSSIARATASRSSGRILLVVASVAIMPT